MLAVLVAIIPGSLIKCNSIDINKRRDKELVDFMCRSVEPRVQIGSTREVLELLTSSLSKIEAIKRPKLNVFEGSASLTSPEKENLDSSKYYCSFTGRPDLNVGLFFPNEHFYDSFFIQWTVVFALLFFGAWLLLGKAIISSQIVLISTIERLVNRQLTDDLQLEVKPNILMRLFDLQVPVLKKIKEHIKQQREIIDRQVKSLADAERFALIANTTAALAHDLKNPVNVVEFSMNSLSWDEFQKRKPSMKSAVLRLRSMIESLKKADLESMIKPDWTVVAWINIINEIEPIARESGASLRLEAAITDPIHVDLPKIERAIINLIRNAIEAGARMVRMHIEKCGYDVVINIQDDGPGVPVGFIPHLFMRGKSHNKEGGSGLGLHFVKEVVEGHGGQVSYSREGAFSVFSMKLIDVVMSGVNSVKDENSQSKISEPEISPAYHIQKIDRIALILRAKDQESELIGMLKQRFPDIEISTTVAGSSFVWSDDFEIAGETMRDRIPFQLINEGESSEKIFDLIINKIDRIRKREQKE